jgi:hypothetical protein
VVCYSLQKLVGAKFRTANLPKARTGCESGGGLLLVAEQHSDKLSKSIVVVIMTRELSPSCKRTEKQPMRTGETRKAKNRAPVDTRVQHQA